MAFRCQGYPNDSDDCQRRDVADYVSPFSCVLQRLKGHDARMQTGPGGEQGEASMLTRLAGCQDQTVFGQLTLVSVNQRPCVSSLSLTLSTA